MEAGSSSRLDTLEQTIEAFQENVRQIAIVASDFQPKSQEVLNQKIHTLVSGLQELDQLRRNFQDIQIPIELLSYLDQGKNPQLYTKEVMDRTLKKNKEVNGKIELYKKFRAHLLKEWTEEMREDAQTYRLFRQRKNEPQSGPGSQNGPESPIAVKDEPMGE